MKNITLQYRDLLEGKMPKETFIRNVRMQFPQWISPVNNFEDAVRILKSKRILNENYNTPDSNIKSIANLAANMSKTQDEVIANAIKLAKADGIKDQYVIKDIIGLAVDEFISMGGQLDATKHRIPATDYSQRRSREDYGYNRVPADPDIPFSSMTEDETLNEAPLVVNGKVVKTYKQNGDGSYSVKYDNDGGQDDNDGGEDVIYASHDDWDKIRALHNQASSLNEAEKKEPTIDQVDYIQLQKGTEFELSKMPIISDENYVKAKQKAYKNLVKDPNAYRHLSVANYKDVKKKDKGLETQEVKKDNLADKANEQKTLVKNAKPNTKDNLGKQERAKKGIPDGVKQLREAMLDEFAVVPEPKKNFAVGHEVATPDGKTGTIEELSQDNTATVKFDDGNTKDYQTNVLEPSSEKVIAQHQGAEVNKSFENKKMSMEELKEKLMKGLKKEWLYRKKGDSTGKQTVTGTTSQADTALTRAGYEKVPGTQDVK